MDFDKYTDYTLTDFVQDEDFIRWAKAPTHKDVAFWKAFQKEHPHKKAVIGEACALVAQLSHTKLQDGLSQEEKSAMLTAIQARISHQAVTAAKPRPLGLRRLWSAPGITAAAAVLLLLVAGWWFLLRDDGLITLTSAYGERQSVELPDGSRVEVNANTTIRYASNWPDSENRKVWLDGEAYFEVAKKQQTGQKFEVITEDLTVEVLGTVFNVNSRREATEVFLEEGKVKLNLNGLNDTLLMEPGELVTYSENKAEKPVKRRVSGEDQISWKEDGTHYFPNTPLKEILEKMEDIYGLTITVQDTSNAARNFRIGIPIENLEQALSLLEVSTSLKLHKQADDSYVLE